MSERADFRVRSGGSTVDVADFRVRSGGSLRDVKEAYARHGGELYRIWPQLLEIDDFEYSTAVLNQRYRIPSATGSASTSTAASYHGNRGLRLSGFLRMWSRPSDGTLENYPDSRPWNLYFRPQTLSVGSQLWFYYGGNSTQDVSHYEYQFVHDDNGAHYFRVQFVNSSGNKTTLDRFDVSSWATGPWRQIRTIPRSGGGFDTELYNLSSGALTGTLATSHSTVNVRDPSKVGYRCGGNAAMDIDYLHITP